MKYIFLFLIFSLSNLLTLHAQTSTCEAKCLSGDCGNGFGKYRFGDCTIYEGNFKNYSLNGSGKYTYNSGEAYDGSWESSKRQGYGKTTWPGGTMHEGYWVNDVMDGQGTIWYSSGEKYVGQCYNSQREGKGIHYNANGTVQYDGYWKNNEKENGTTTTTTTNPPEDKTAEDDYSWLYDDEETESDEPEKTEEANTSAIEGEKTQGKSSGNFCTDYKAIVASAKEDTSFQSVEGSIRSVEGDYIKTTINNTTKSIAGAEDCYIQYLLGSNYYAIFGTYTSQADAEVKYNEILGKIKSCVSDKIYETGKATEYIMKSVSVINKYADGFDLDGDYLSIYKDNDNGGKYSVRLSISSGAWNSRVYTIASSGGSGDANFDSNLKKIMESSRTAFSSVLGEKHETDGFLGKTTTWDINASIPGIFDLSYTEGGWSLFSDDLKGTNYEGTDATEAKNRFNALSEKVKKCLGSSYAFIKTDSDGEILKNVFTLKSEMDNEKTPVVTVKYYYSSSSNKYSVTIDFAYKAFSGIF